MWVEVQRPKKVKSLCSLLSTKQMLASTKGKLLVSPRRSWEVAGLLGTQEVRPAALQQSSHLQELVTLQVSSLQSICSGQRWAPGGWE